MAKALWGILWSLSRLRPGTARLDRPQIDRVFLTGGTSFVPAVRAIFDRRFDASRIETGGEFESIASGLALIGREPDPDLWSERHPARSM